LYLLIGTSRCLRLDRRCRVGVGYDAHPCVLPVGEFTLVGFTGLTVPGVNLILGVDARPIVSQGKCFVAGTVRVAIGQQLATEEHSVIAESVADNEAPVSQPEHEGDGAVVKLTNDLAAAAQHRAAVPSGQADKPVTVPGVTRYVATADRRAKGGEDVTVMGYNPDLKLSAPLAFCFHRDSPVEVCWSHGRFDGVSSLAVAPPIQRDASRFECCGEVAIRGASECPVAYDQICVGNRKVRLIAEGHIMHDDNRLKALAGAHFAIGLLIGILATIRLPIPVWLEAIRLVPLIASSLSQAFLLSLWVVTCTTSFWKRIAGLFAGTVYLEMLLSLAVSRTFLYVSAVTLVITTASLLVLRTKGFGFIRQFPKVPLARAESEPLMFSIRGLMLLTAAVALLSVVARALQAISFPERRIFIIILFPICFVTVGFVGFWSVLVKAQPFGRASFAVVLSPILGVFLAIASSADHAGVYIIVTLILYLVAMLGSFLVVRSCGYRFVRSHSLLPEPLSDSENAGGTARIGKSAGKCP
jgi:hypothetical protein